MVLSIKGSVGTSVICLYLFCIHMARCIDQPLYVKNHESPQRAGRACLLTMFVRGGGCVVRAGEWSGVDLDS